MSEHWDIYVDWNPWHGCTKISPGCKYCYVYRQDEMYGSTVASSLCRKDLYFYFFTKRIHRLKDCLPPCRPHRAVPAAFRNTAPCPFPKNYQQNDCSHFDYFRDASRNTQIQMAYIRNSIKFVGVIHLKCASGYVDVKEAGAPTRFPSFHFIS